ncbi:iron chelate uptake ABC transporter family permease subunit [Pseudooceanicola sp. C21-150M6]|uniref:iron chelate uptake ABC transporter family permease subunit n=1 Tax=Pseudooceanicola sp. C21-150M6 TaxID=3434355 RepID=UPI003D7F6BE8
MARRLGFLAVILATVSLLFVVVAARAPWEFLLPFRLMKLAALIIVGASLAVATVLFQTLTANRILTPSLLGFDALYMLIVTLLIQLLGAAGFNALSPLGLFLMTVVAMSGLGLGLFTALMRMAQKDMIRLVLTGIVIGLLIRSMTEFIQRIIDPSEFQMVQSMSFARFTQADPQMLLLAGLAVLPALAGAWALRHRLDVLTLGEDAAIGLGERPSRVRRQAMLAICTLVAVATALVGPLSAGGFAPSSFFGIIVAAFARMVTPTHRHAILLPCAAIIGALVLSGGQFVLERLLSLDTPLMVVIELIGGFIFLAILLKRRLA